MFRGVVRMVFTFVVPLAVMTTFPAEALLGRLPLGRVVLAVAFPFLVLGNSYVLHLLILAQVYAVLALALNFQLGWPLLR